MQKSFIGKGQIYLGLASGVGGLKPIGNASALVFNIEEETKEQKDYTNASGGLANSISSISSVGAEMTLLDLSAENLSIALRGLNVAVTAGTVSAEVHTAYKGALVPLAYTPDLAQTITVTGPSGTPAYVLNTDYTVTRAGIVILAGGSITDEAQIEVSYTKLAGNVVEALTSAAAEYKLVFDGLNEAESGKAVILTVHRVKFTPTSGLGFITDEFAELPLTASVLKDSSIVTAGISQYFKVAQAA